MYSYDCNHTSCFSELGGLSTCQFLAGPALKDRPRPLFRLTHIDYEMNIELVSKELNHFGVIADLFRQFGGHSSRFMLFCSF